MEGRNAVTIDGRMGEGGGQVLRSSLSLAAALGLPVVIENVRGGRKKPGLLRQHRTALRALRDLTGGTIEGDELGSPRVRFVPGPKVWSGDYRFGIGSAGSTMLVFQTVLAPLMLADGPSTVVLEGGTHNPMAPTFECIVESFAPCLAAMGVTVTGKLVRPGFFPAGGGEVHFRVDPVGAAAPFELTERGLPNGKSCAVIAQNVPNGVPDREWEAFARKTDWPRDRFLREELPRGPGPGNLMLARIRHGTHQTTLVSFGAKDRPSKAVAHALASAVKRFESSRAPVDEYLADQLMLPMAILAGGAYRAARLTEHATTNARVINAFLPGAVELDGETVAVARSWKGR